MTVTWTRIADEVDRHGRAALVTVLDARGSVPRGAGARMLVLPDGRFSGTIGGGALEWKAQGEAQAALNQGAPQFRTRALALGPELGQCCGGRATVAVEILAGSDLALLRTLAAAERNGVAVLSRPDAEGRLHRRTLSGDEADSLPDEAFVRLPDGSFFERFRDDRTDLLLFGAGHVGRAIVLAFAGLPFRIDWIDARPDAFPGHVPANASIRRPDPPAAALAEAPEGAFVLVMTHSHPLDLDICAAALRRGAFPYVGLIGSVTKRARFMSQFASMGLGAAAEARLTCPVGLADIKDKAPASIAIGVAAELLILREHLAARRAPERRLAADA